MEVETNFKYGSEDGSTMEVFINQNNKIVVTVGDRLGDDFHISVLEREDVDHLIPRLKEMIEIVDEIAKGGSDNGGD